MQSTGQLPEGFCLAFVSLSVTEFILRLSPGSSWKVRGIDWHSATCIMETNLGSRTRMIPNGCSKSCSGVPELTHTVPLAWWRRIWGQGLEWFLTDVRNHAPAYRNFYSEQGNGFFPFLAVSWSFWHIAVSIQYRKHSKSCTVVTDSISHRPFCLGIKTLSLKYNKSKAALVPIINFQITCILGSCCLLKKSLILVAYALVIRESSHFPVVSAIN